MNNSKTTEKKTGGWTAPGEVALCRKVSGGDMAAGILLHRIAVLWKLRKKKLERFGREWLAMSRADWARSAGLSEAEMKDRALPRLKKACAAFIEVRPMRLTPDSPNILWISLDPQGMANAVMGDSSLPWDMYEMALNGLGIYAKAVKYPYKDAI
jgi:hypothetical protein